MQNYRRLFFLICIITFSIAAALDASVVINPFEGMSESVEIVILELGNDFPGASQNAVAAIKEMNVSDDKLLLAWAKLARLLAATDYLENIDLSIRSRDAVLRLIDLDVALAGLLATLISDNKDESILACFVIKQIGEALEDSIIKPLPGTVPLLVRALEDQDAQIRETASRLLGIIPTHAEAAVPGLINTLNIVSHAHDKDIASLIQQFNHIDAEVKKNARKLLIEMGEATVPALIVKLNHENATVREKIVDILFFIKDSVPHKKNKDIVRALVKALKDDVYKVRFAAMECFFGMGKSVESVMKLPPELATEVMSGLVQLLYYGSPFFGGFDVGAVLHSMEDQGRPAITEALHSSSWSLRFGAALAYGSVFARLYNKQAMLGHHNVPPLPKAVVPMLAEGLTHPDWRTQEDAAKVLKRLRNLPSFQDYADEARQALEGLPPFGIISQTIKDEAYVMDSDSLDSLNTDGITFKFNRSIYREGEITIKPVDGEPLGWNSEKSSHSVTITPPEGKELVKGQNYTIQLRDFRDVLWNQVDAEIDFRTKGDRDIIRRH